MFYYYHLLFVWALQMMFSIRYCDWKFVWFSQCFNMCNMSNPSHSINLINVVISRFLCNFSKMRLEVSKWLGWRFKSFWDVTWSGWVFCNISSKDAAIFKGKQSEKNSVDSTIQHYITEDLNHELQYSRLQNWVTEL